MGPCMERANMRFMSSIKPAFNFSRYSGSPSTSSPTTSFSWCMCVGRERGDGGEREERREGGHSRGRGERGGRGGGGGGGGERRGWRGEGGEKRGEEDVEEGGRVIKGRGGREGQTL